MHYTPKKFSFKKGFLLSFGLCFLTSCSVEIEEHGKRIGEELLDKIVPGSTQKQQVLSVLGAPSTENDFGNKVWFYVASNNRKTALFGDKLLSRSIIKIMFDDENTVTKITMLTEKDQKTVEHSQNKTPTAGQEIGVLQQLLGNVGRFNTDSQSK